MRDILFKRYPLVNNVIVLPCKVGDTVYIIGEKYRCGRYESWINTGKFRLNDLENLGKTVFLTHKEAEAELEWRKRKQDVH